MVTKGLSRVGVTGCQQGFPPAISIQRPTAYIRLLRIMLKDKDKPLKAAGSYELQFLERFQKEVVENVWAPQNSLSF